MARDSSAPGKSTRSQHYSSNSNKQQQYPSVQASRSQQRRINIEQQQQQKQRNALLRAKFGANASQLRLTVFIILTVALVLTCIAFFSSNWLEVERRYYGSKFKKLGLWRMCFNSFSDPNDSQFRKFYVGCRWVFAEEYKPIRKFLLPGLLKIQFHIVASFSLIRILTSVNSLSTS